MLTMATPTTVPGAAGGMVASSATSFAVGRPDANVGDKLLMLVFSENVSTTLSPPSGWAAGDLAQSSNAYCQFFTKTVTGSEASSYTISNPTGDRFGAVILAYPALGAINDTDPLTSSSLIGGAQPQTLPFGAISQITGDRLIGFGVVRAGQTGATTPAGFTPAPGFTTVIETALDAVPWPITGTQAALYVMHGVASSTGANDVPDVSFSTVVGTQKDAASLLISITPA